MSESMINVMQRMEVIRRRIEEIRKLGKGEASPPAGEDRSEVSSLDSSFAQLLQKSLDEDRGTSLEPLQELYGSDILSADSLLGNLSEGVQKNIDPSLLARALEMYKQQK